jgi:hypothetical protein
MDLTQSQVTSGSSTRLPHTSNQVRHLLRNTVTPGPRYHLMVSTGLRMLCIRSMDGPLGRPQGCAV